MSDVVGVELCADVVRAVALGGLRQSARNIFETPWDPAHPLEAVALLRTQLGPTRRIALNVGLGFLHLKHVKLPPAPVAERRRMLALEPDRFFPVQDEPVVVGLVDEENFAFAVDADLLERCILAFEGWAPVECVEAAPVSLARALGPDASGTFSLPAGEDEYGLVEVHAGRVRSARRLSGAPGEADAQPLPARDGVPGDFLCALGAARGVDGSLAVMLVPDGRADRIKRRRITRMSLGAAVCALALVVALWALDRSRQRTLERIGRELVLIAPRAQQAIEYSDRLTTLDREARAVAELAGRRVDPLSVLAALSALLPEGATVLSVKANGADWQIDGTASNAAAIVPLLDRDNRFENVRFLSASSRFRDGKRTLETFSIAFRVRPAD